MTPNTAPKEQTVTPNQNSSGSSFRRALKGSPLGNSPVPSEYATPNPAIATNNYCSEQFRNHSRPLTTLAKDGNGPKADTRPVSGGNGWKADISPMVAQPNLGRAE